jgi:hypothetical protein
MALTLAGNRAPQTTGNSDAPQKSNQAPAIPFTRSSRRKSILAWQTNPTTLGASAVPIPPIQVPAAGHLAGLEMLVNIATTGNAATTSAPTGITDTPWSVFNQISVVNAAGDNIISPIDGYALYAINKYGAFRGQPPFVDPRRDSYFTALTTGAGGTAPTGQFRLFIPFETDPSQAFCAVPNLAANKAYIVQIQLNPLASLYAGAGGNGTQPNGVTTVTITLISHYWSVPAAVNAGGVPQQQSPTGSGSVALWQIEPAVVTPGDKLIQLHNVGNVIREAIFILRTSTGFRTATDWPALSQIVLNNDLMEYKPTQAWQAEIAERFGYNTGTIDTAGGLDSGVFVWSQPLMGENLLASPSNARDPYLITQDATLLQLRGTSFGAGSSTLQMYTNAVKPISAASLYEPHVR